MKYCYTEAKYIALFKALVGFGYGTITTQGSYIIMFDE